MRMNKAAILFMVMAVSGIASAVPVTNNGGFNVNAAGWNAAGGGGAWTPAHVPTGGNPGGYLTLQSANNTWSVWYQVVNESLAVWGISPGTEIVIKADMIDLGALNNNTVGGLKVESWNTALLSEGASQFTVTNTWAPYSFNYTIHPDAQSVKLVFTNVNYNNKGPARFGFDNAQICFPNDITPALFPIPTVGNTGIAPASDILSWTNPEPLKNPNDIIRCDVWFRESTTPLADPNLVPGQPGATKIVINEPVNSVDLSSKGITLLQDHYYYWKVDVIDPNDGGGPVVIDGFTWSFKTGDAPPVADAGPDQYVWLNMDDGTPADGKVTLTLTGDYTDDQKSPVTTTWALDELLTQTDPATVVSIAAPNEKTTAVTIDNTGWFFFTFTATDTAGSSVDTVNVGVYVDACAAAIADPADIPAAYPNGYGDLNGDCKIDMNDFVIMAATWLDCVSAKLGCTP